MKIKIGFLFLITLIFVAQINAENKKGKRESHISFYAGYGGGGGIFQATEPNAFTSSVSLYWLNSSFPSIPEYIQRDSISIGLLALFPLNQNSKTNPLSIGAEYAPAVIPFLAFGTEFSSTKTVLKSDSAALLHFVNMRNWLLSAKSVQSASSGQSTPASLFYLFQSFVSMIFTEGYKSGWNFHYNLPSVFVRFYLQAGKKFEPYVAFGAGKGSCTGDVSCDIFKSFGRIGFRFHWNKSSVFVYSNLEYQNLLFRLPNNNNLNIADRIFTFGIGFRL